MKVIFGGSLEFSKGFNFFDGLGLLSLRIGFGGFLLVFGLFEDLSLGFKAGVVVGSG